MKRLVVGVLILCGVGCSHNVTIPPAGQDTAPTITMNAFVVQQPSGYSGDIEPGKANVGMTSSVAVTEGAKVQFSGSAKNPGGVQQFSVKVKQAGRDSISGHRNRHTRCQWTGSRFTEPGRNERSRWLRQSAHARHHVGPRHCDGDSYQFSCDESDDHRDLQSRVEQYHRGRWRQQQSGSPAPRSAQLFSCQS